MQRSYLGMKTMATVAKVKSGIINHGDHKLHGEPHHQYLPLGNPSANLRKGISFFVLQMLKVEVTFSSCASSSFSRTSPVQP